MCMYTAGTLTLEDRGLCVPSCVHGDDPSSVLECLQCARMGKISSSTWGLCMGLLRAAGYMSSCGCDSLA